MNNELYKKYKYKHEGTNIYIYLVKYKYLVDNTMRFIYIGFYGFVHKRRGACCLLVNKKTFNESFKVFRESDLYISCGNWFHSFGPLKVRDCLKSSILAFGMTI
jgi:hypothetical protein